MIITEDMLYVTPSLVDRGLTKVVPYSIRLDRLFTESEKEANLAFAAKFGSRSEEWSDHCEEARQKIAGENYKLMEFLEQHFSIGQFRKNYPSDYVLWFWCSTIDQCSGKPMGRDYSYITLTLRNEKDVDANVKIFEKAKSLLRDYGAKSIQAIFQYSQIENTEFVNQEAERIFGLCEGKFINYGRHTGKLERFEDGYAFKKKYAKKYFYKVSAMGICQNIIC